MNNDQMRRLIHLGKLLQDLHYDACRQRSQLDKHLLSDKGIARATCDLESIDFQIATTLDEMRLLLKVPFVAAPAYKKLCVGVQPGEHAGTVVIAIHLKAGDHTAVLYTEKHSTERATLAVVDLPPDLFGTAPADKVLT